LVKTIIDPTKEEEQDEDAQPVIINKQNQLLKEYIDIIYYGETMRLERYKYIHDLNWYDPIPPLYYPVEELTDEPANPFNINYSWVKKHKITNRLPNHFVF